MKSPRQALLALITLALLALASGCTSQTGNDTSIPWSRPASWEGQVPGMGSTGDTSGVR